MKCSTFTKVGIYTCFLFLGLYASPVLAVNFSTTFFCGSSVTSTLTGFCDNPGTSACGNNRGYCFFKPDGTNLYCHKYALDTAEGYSWFLPWGVGATTTGDYTVLYGYSISNCAGNSLSTCISQNAYFYTEVLNITANSCMLGVSATSSPDMPEVVTAINGQTLILALGTATIAALVAALFFAKLWK